MKNTQRQSINRQRVSDAGDPMIRCRVQWWWWWLIQRRTISKRQRTRTRAEHDWAKQETTHREPQTTIWQRRWEVDENIYTRWLTAAGDDDCWWALIERHAPLSARTHTTITETRDEK